MAILLGLLPHLFFLTQHLREQNGMNCLLHNFCFEHSVCRAMFYIGCSTGAIFAADAGSSSLRSLPRRMLKKQCYSLKNQVQTAMGP